MAHKKKPLRCDIKDTKQKKRVNPTKLASKVRLFHPLKNRSVKVEDLKIVSPNVVKRLKEPAKKMVSVNVTRSDVLNWLRVCKIDFKKHNEQIYVLENTYCSFYHILVFANRLRLERGLPIFAVL